MIRERRERFNRTFTAGRYDAMLQRLQGLTGGPVQFHLSETPCFLPHELIDRLIDASQTMVDQLLDDAAYRRAADAIVPPRFRVARAEERPTFVAVDFGLVDVGGGRLEGRLVELQAFASLFGFQLALGEACIEAFDLDDVTPLLDGLSHEEYLRLMRDVLVGSHDPREVVLMEIDPAHQKTWPDFAATERLWDVRAIDVRDVIKQGRRLWYRRDGELTRIARVYNRVIPDELEHKDVALPFDYRDDLDVEWMGGPDWFFRVSKFGIPWLRHPWVPPAKYLSDVDVAALPANRDGLLLKPLFSFAGGGILFAPSDADLAAIPADQRHLYLLQERVEFTPVIETPYGPTKVEVRIMMVRDGARYRPVLPLLRMGRGRMMGVSFNKDQAWVGASAGLLPASRK
jgi:hypothetical protein